MNLHPMLTLIIGALPQRCPRFFFIRTIISLVLSAYTSVCAYSLLLTAPTICRLPLSSAHRRGSGQTGLPRFSVQGTAKLSSRSFGYRFTSSIATGARSDSPIGSEISFSTRTGRAFRQQFFVVALDRNIEKRRSA